MPGKYIVIEGHDGTGKNTQLELLEAELKKRGHNVTKLHEPGGTPIGEELRTIVKNGQLERDADTNLLLFTACRHEMWHRVALPALSQGDYVISARNYYSTLAYQGYGEGMDLDFIRDITHKFTDNRYMQPDVSIVLSLPEVSIAKERISSRAADNEIDTFESRNSSFQDRVQAGYLAVASESSSYIVNAAESIDEVQHKINQLLFKVV